MVRETALQITEKNGKIQAIKILMTLEFYQRFSKITIEQLTVVDN